MTNVPLTHEDPDWSDFEDIFEELTFKFGSVAEIQRVIELLTERNLWQFMRTSPEEHTIQFIISGERKAIFAQQVDYMIKVVKIDPDLEPDHRYFDGMTVNSALDGFGLATYPPRQPRKEPKTKWEVQHPPFSKE